MKGPERCPRTCTDCEPGEHHWLADCVDAGDEPDPRPLEEQDGPFIGYVCKHCPAYMLYEDAPAELQESCA